MLKYFDVQAKIVHDLQEQLHHLNRQNHKLRNTIIAAPTWELHARTHSTPDAIKKEREQEKALIAMHNEILKANTTYQFKPRGGGRMYFPSPVAGRELPLKPKPHVSELSVYQSGSILENPSLLSGAPSRSHSSSWGWTGSSDSRYELRTGSKSGSRSVSRGESRGDRGDRGEPSIELRGISEDEQGLMEDSRALSRKSAHTSSKLSSKMSSKQSQKVFALGATALDNILVRKHGATGPVVFRNKRAARDPETVHDVPSIEPLKETTRLGYNKEGKDWQQEDWPKKIRERVSTALQTGENVRQPRDPKLDATGTFIMRLPTLQNCQICVICSFLLSQSRCLHGRRSTLQTLPSCPTSSTNPSGLSPWRRLLHV